MAPDSGVSATMFPTGPAAPRPAMQPLGAPGTPASPQALPYNAFPAPQIGMASAGRPASPIAPMMQNTQAQIGDALAAARGPQQPPQLAVQPPQQGGMTPTMGPLGMSSQQYQQPPQQLKRPEGHESFMQSQMAPQNGMAPPSPPSYDGQMPPGMMEMLQGARGRRFWGGFNWGQMQPQGDGRTPYPMGGMMRPNMNFPTYTPSRLGHGGGADEGGMMSPFGGFNWQAGGR